MKQLNLAEKIRDKALELGFEACGILPVDAVRGYSKQLEQRMEDFPHSKPLLSSCAKYGNPDQGREWAKSVVVCITRYGKYKVPRHLDGYIAKYYLYDYKLQTGTREFENHLAFGEYLGYLGLQYETELHGVTSGRLAASLAGLGTVRRNNFFYTGDGSWLHIDSWLIDQELELISKTELPQCPEGCRKCMEACPTKALSAPYRTDMGRCITFLTWGARDITPEPLREAMGSCIYGCDKCQNACPMNAGRWEEKEEYPGLAQLAEKISLEKILAMDEKEMQEVLVPRFFFIRSDAVWKWKCNVIRAMANNYQPFYLESLQNAALDSNEKVREMAQWALEIVKTALSE